MSGSGLITGDDGLARCAWASSTPDYQRYHDEEWGRPVHGEAQLFERLTLEAFQSGLSWLTILRKRDGFRRAFAGFDPEVVAAFGPEEVARLLLDASIVRNRAKIAAAVNNAKAVLATRDAVAGGLDALFWSFAPQPAPPAPTALGEVPASTPASVALSKSLKRHGFVFVGPTTAYAAMQACGLVDDHLSGCSARLTRSGAISRFSEAIAAPSETVVRSLPFRAVRAARDNAGDHDVYPPKAGRAESVHGTPQGWRTDEEGDAAWRP